MEFSFTVIFFFQFVEFIIFGNIVPLDFAWLSLWRDILWYYFYFYGFYFVLRKYLTDCPQTPYAPAFTSQVLECLSPVLDQFYLLFLKAHTLLLNVIGKIHNLNLIIEWAFSVLVLFGLCIVCMLCSSFCKWRLPLLSVFHFMRRIWKTRGCQLYNLIRRVCL